ncbi:MAG: AI-2E family transporter [Gemmatimonadota bacterium]|nr:AI-2E family transporter [Gemmatimonadota bacterium]
MGGLLVLAVLFTLHIARDFFLPIALAILLDFLLKPLVRGLKRFRLPEPVGAGVVVLAFLTIVGATGYALSGPAAGWVARAPEGFQVVQAKLAALRQPFEKVTTAAEKVEEATEVSGTDKPSEVQIQGPSLVTQVLGGTANFLGTLTVILFLTFLLLAVGDLFLEKLVGVLPQFRDKKTAVLIARATEAQISAYLFTTTLINLGVGVVTAVAMLLVGMPNPWLWGAVAAVLNYVPYVGAMVNMVVLAVAALLSFDTVGRALIVPAVFLGINLVEGNLVTPAIQGRSMSLNPVALFVGFTFWWYIWGIPGAIMAVPMMATMKIICDHIDALSPVGEFLGS